jgi:hypothetical protein
MAPTPAFLMRMARILAIDLIMTARSVTGQQECSSMRQFFPRTSLVQEVCCTTEGSCDDMNMPVVGDAVDYGTCCPVFMDFLRDCGEFANENEFNTAGMTELYGVCLDFQGGCEEGCSPLNLGCRAAVVTDTCCTAASECAPETSMVPTECTIDCGIVVTSFVEECLEYLPSEGQMNHELIAFDEQKCQRIGVREYLDQVQLKREGGCTINISHHAPPPPPQPQPQPPAASVNSTNSIVRCNDGTVSDLAQLQSPFTGDTSDSDDNYDLSCGGHGNDAIFSILLHRGHSLDIGMDLNSYDSRHETSWGGRCPGQNIVACQDDDTRSQWTNDQGSAQTVFFVVEARSTLGVGIGGPFSFSWTVSGGSGDGDGNGHRLLEEEAANDLSWSGVWIHHYSDSACLWDDINNRVLHLNQACCDPLAVGGDGCANGFLRTCIAECALAAKTFVTDCARVLPFFPADELGDLDSFEQHCVDQQSADFLHAAVSAADCFHCPELETLERATIAFSNTNRNEGSTATYTCSGGGLPIDGDATRVCEADGSWSGVAPTQCSLSCKTLYDAGERQDGVYTIDAGEVFCDMNGGGWSYQSQGVPYRLDFTGGTQTVVTGAVQAEYKFTLFGAAGGQSQSGQGGCSYPTFHGNGASNCEGGYGGMVQGSKTFSPATIIYVEVGGQGDSGNAADTGAQHEPAYNGGGRGYAGGSSGGGATDIRVAAGDLSSRLLVAAGGGGCGKDACNAGGGDGGGLSGGNGHEAYSTGGGAPGTGASPSVPGSGGSPGLGLGADYGAGNDCGGGGGGYYGGGACQAPNAAAGGGSSYYDGMDGDKVTTAGVNAGNGYAEYIVH